MIILDQRQHMLHIMGCPHPCRCNTTESPPPPTTHHPPPTTHAAAPLPDDDKAQVRALVLEALVVTPPAVRSQFDEIARTLVHCDYPEHWPHLLEQVQHGLRAQVRGPHHQAGISIFEFEGTQCTCPPPFPPWAAWP
jgi:hypothetical protein